LFEILLGPHPRVLRQSPQASNFLLGIRMTATMGFMSDLNEKSAVPEGKETPVQQIVFG
jgi:hypothetical protein